VHENPYRPQPRFDRDADGGMTTSVGRVRPDAALEHGIKYMLVSHNTRMGAAKGAVLAAEYLTTGGVDLTSGRPARSAHGRAPSLTRHLGRWIAFQERWPEVADLMTGEPDLMGKLEGATDEAARAALLALLPKALTKSLAADQALEDFSTRGELGPVMTRLIYFPPASRAAQPTTP
jgi:hypothetical protein